MYAFFTQFFKNLEIGKIQIIYDTPCLHTKIIRYRNYNFNIAFELNAFVFIF